MSEQKNDARKKFTINLEEHVDFAPIASTKYITSNEFARLVSELFHNVFADFEGTLFEMSGNEPTISLIFNHGEYGEDVVCGCERLTSKKAGSTIIDSNRTRDRQLRDGDRYIITDDCKDVVSTLLTRRAWNNGNPDYKKICSEFSDRGPANSFYYDQRGTQFTKISFIDLNKVCELLFGDKDEEGNAVEYSANVTAAMNPQYNVMGSPITSNYVLNIQQISSKELADFCNKVGVCTQGINIVR